MNTRMMTGAIGACAAGALLLTSCSGGDDASGGKGEPIEIGLFSGDEGYAVSYLWKAVLEDEGYEVNITEADHGPVFQGLSDGDFDVSLDVWLPVTHASYIEQYGDDIEEIGVWNDEAKLTIAVNADAPIDSLTELNDNADYFGGQLYGIEAGAGLTKATEEQVIPDYGLTDIEFKTSSTPAMLSQLQQADAAGEPIAVTLWRPHWAYDAYDIKDLEDPEGALGRAENLTIYGSSDFSDEQPEVAEWLAGFEMDSDRLHSLENLLFNENEGASDLEPLVRDWMADNQEYVDSLTP